MVDEISRRLLEGAWKPHTDGKFYRCEPEDGLESLGEAKRIQNFLRIIKENTDPHLLLREGRKSHYEDIYAATLQMVRDETREVTNPLIAKSLEWIKAASTLLWVRGEHHIDKNRFASLADRATDFVQWVVYHEIREVSKPVGMNVISAVARATRELDIFSLNHDLLIESQLNQDGVAFADGFSSKQGDARIFSSCWKESDNAIRLLKLHGSVNWYMFRFKEWDQVAIVNENPDYCCGGDGKSLEPLNTKPMFLIGTTVKEQVYGIGFLGEFFTRFRELLSKHQTLICCGYGWRDKGINMRLNQWLRDAKANRIVILHNGPVEQVARTRFWYFQWEDYIEANKVLIVPKWLSECSVADIQPYFDT
jgi:hypothetical protein